MTVSASAIYVGRVIHQRITPRRHRLSYGVFSVLLDVDGIDDLARTTWLFSRNRFNAVSFHDRDHGRGDGTGVAAHARSILADAGLNAFTYRISLLCYPRIFGYVFNPLSVYFCWDQSGRLGVVIYEVSNTFHERKSYVILVGEEDQGLVRQSCTKEMYVSPFTSPEASYGFTIRPPAGDVMIGITLHDAGGAVLNARFQGNRRALTTATLASALLRYPLMTLKVIGAIHVEAARLWLKGVPLVTRHASPSFSFTIVGADGAVSPRPATHLSTSAHV